MRWPLCRKDKRTFIGKYGAVVSPSFGSTLSLSASYWLARFDLLKGKSGRISPIYLFDLLTPSNSKHLLKAMLDEGQWTVVAHETVAPRGLVSEVLVARKV